MISTTQAGVYAMRFLPTVMHGVADHVVALVVLGLPYIYGMHGTSKAFLLVLGAAALFYSLLTEYELGFLPVIPFRIHLALDKLFAALKTKVLGLDGERIASADAIPARTRAAYDRCDRQFN